MSFSLPIVVVLYCGCVSHFEGKNRTSDDLCFCENIVLFLRRFSEGSMTGFYSSPSSWNVVVIQVIVRCTEEHMDRPIGFAVQSFDGSPATCQRDYHARLPLL